MFHIFQHPRVLGYSAKWLGGEQITEINHKTDEFMIKRLWKLMDEAEIVIAQNGDQFDVKFIQARMFFWKLDPPSPFRTVDTLKVTHKKFKLLSHKQGDVSKYRGNTGKLETNLQLWIDCYYGKKKALAHMKKYNARDVIGLEENYKSLLPWISNHPNVAINSQECPVCRATGLAKWGLDRQNFGIYQRWRCKKCKSIRRGRENLMRHPSLDDKPGKIIQVLR